MTVADCAGSLAPGKLQLDDSIQFVERGLNPLWLLKARVGNNGPTRFTILQQPFHRPLINSARSADQPGPTLRNKWRQVLLKQRARHIALNIARAGNHDGAIGCHRIRNKLVRQTVSLHRRLKPKEWQPSLIQCWRFITHPLFLTTLSSSLRSRSLHHSRHLKKPRSLWRFSCDSVVVKLIVSPMVSLKFSSRISQVAANNLLLGAMGKSEFLRRPACRKICS